MPRKRRTSKQKPATKEWTYTVDEFLDHFRALPIVRKYEHISRPLGSAEQVEVRDDQCFEINALRIMDYFSQIYPQEEEAREKSVLFILMLSHLAKHRESYDSERFAVFTDTDEASMISVSLLRAIHHHFTSRPWRQLPPEEEIVAAIKDTARNLSKADQPGELR
jgi:hypothetical protein